MVVKSFGLSYPGEIDLSPFSHLPHLQKASLEHHNYFSLGSPQRLECSSHDFEEILWMLC